MKDERNLTDYLYKLCTNENTRDKYLQVTTNLVLFIDGPYEMRLFEGWEITLRDILYNPWCNKKDKKIANKIIEKIKPFYEFELYSSLGLFQLCF